MSTPNANPSKAEEIRIGISGACLMMPKESETRAEEINRLHQLAEDEKEAVAEAKDQVGLKDALKRANKVYGISKTTLKILKLLDGVKAAGDRAAVIAQVVILSKDKGDLDKDLVTLAEEAEAQAGQQADDQGSVFDKTSEGERRGGKDAQPKHVDEPAPAAAAAPTAPGVPLDEALRQLEAYNAANPPKRGTKPKERKRLEAQVEAAEKARLEAEAAEPQPARTDDFDGEEPGPQHPAHQQLADQDQPAADLDDDIPPPAPKKRASPLPNAGGQGSYTLN